MGASQIINADGIGRQSYAPGECQGELLQVIETAATIRRKPSVASPQCSFSVPGLVIRYVVLRCETNFRSTFHILVRYIAPCHTIECYVRFYHVILHFVGFYYVTLRSKTETGDVQLFGEEVEEHPAAF